MCCECVGEVNFLESQAQLGGAEYIRVWLFLEY